MAPTVLASGSASGDVYAAAMQLASVACGAGTHVPRSSAAAAAEAQWWAVAGLFAILLGGSLGTDHALPHVSYSLLCPLPRVDFDKSPLEPLRHLYVQHHSSATAWSVCTSHTGVALL